MTELVMTRSDDAAASETCCRAPAALPKKVDGGASAETWPYTPGLGISSGFLLTAASFRCIRNARRRCPRRSEMAAAPSMREHGRSDDAAGSES